MIKVGDKLLCKKTTVYSDKIAFINTYENKYYIIIEIDYGEQDKIYFNK